MANRSIAILKNIMIKNISFVNEKFENFVVRVYHHNDDKLAVIKLIDWVGFFSKPIKSV